MTALNPHIGQGTSEQAFRRGLAAGALLAVAMTMAAFGMGIIPPTAPAAQVPAPAAPAVEVPAAPAVQAPALQAPAPPAPVPNVQPLPNVQPAAPIDAQNPLQKGPIRAY